MRALLRIILVIPAGYIAGCIVAGMVAVLSVYDPSGDPDFGMEGFVIGGGIVAGMYFGAFALLPALVLIVFAEAFSWRSFFFHAPAGAAVALGLTLVQNEAAAHPPATAATMLACGFAGGAIYWLIAGRMSGAVHPARPEAEGGGG